MPRYADVDFASKLSRSTSANVGRSQMTAGPMAAPVYESVIVPLPGHLTKTAADIRTQDIKTRARINLVLRILLPGALAMWAGTNLAMDITAHAMDQIAAQTSAMRVLTR